MIAHDAIPLAFPSAWLSTLAQAPFIHPQFAMAASAMLVIPVLIHLINRRRYKRMPWAAMQFLRAAYKKSSRRMRFEQWLLLLLRMAIIACFGAAIARPYFPIFADSPLRQGRALRIILLDNSASMNAKIEADAPLPDASRLTRAIEVAISMIDSFDTSDGVCLYTSSGANLAIIADPAFDRRRIRDHIERLSPSLRRSDWDRALQGVHASLTDTDVPDGNRFLYIISDFATTDWLTDSDDSKRSASMQRLAQKAKVSLIRISDDDIPNLAVTALQTESSPAGANQPIRMSANVINHSSVTKSGNTLQVRIDDRLVRTLLMEPLPPHANRSVPFSIASPTPGEHVVSISLIDPNSGATQTPSGGISQDDHRALAMDIPGRLPVLLVDGRPGSDAYSSATGYLAAALCPFADEESCELFAPTIISSRDLALEPLDPFAVVALCDVSRLDAAQWMRLRAFANNGGGVVFFAGEHVDIDHWNTHGFKDGDGVLPCELAGFRGSKRDDVTERKDSPRRFAPDALKHPIVSVFADHKDGGLFSARVTKSLETNRLSSRAEIVLFYDDKNPAIVLHAVGDGQACLVTTSADMTWTNLPAKGDFVALIVNLFTHLSASASALRTVTVGHTISERILPSTADRIAHVEAPDGTLATTMLKLEDHRLVLNPEPFEQTGIYKIDLGRRTIRVAVNADPAESDLATSTRKQLQDTLKFDFDWIDASKHFSLTAKSETTEIGDKLLLILLVLLVIETRLAQRFGANR